MSDAEARALGSGNLITVMNKETGVEEEFSLRPIDVLHLCDLEKEALSYYRRTYLQTFQENADLLGEQAKEILVEEMRQAGRWDLDDLPKKTAFDCLHVPVTPKLKAWVKVFHEESGGKTEDELTDKMVKVLLTTALDQERIATKLVKHMTGRMPRMAKVRYDQWWVTGAMEGMVAFIYHSIRIDHPEMTKEKVRAWPIPSLFEGSRKVESITSPAIKNG